MSRTHRPSRIDEITALFDRCLAECELLPSVGSSPGLRAYRPAMGPVSRRRR